MPDPENQTKRPPQAWLMVLWLVCCLVVVGFALFSYIAGMWYPHME
jgi:hypothetical protein